MKKSVLFVIDNLVMGGVTRVLSNLLQHLDYNKYDVDLLVLHYYEDMQVFLPPQVTVLKGGRTYRYIDRSIGSILKSRDVPALLGKLKLVFLLKSGLIKKAITASRKKLLTKAYDTEVSFSDGFTEIFVAQGNTPRKLAWFHGDISVLNDSARYAGLIQASLDQMDGCVGVSQQVKRAYEQQYHDGRRKNPGTGPGTRPASAGRSRYHPSGLCGPPVRGKKLLPFCPCPQNAPGCRLSGCFPYRW